MRSGMKRLARNKTSSQTAWRWDVDSPFSPFPAAYSSSARRCSREAVFTRYTLFLCAAGYKQDGVHSGAFVRIPALLIRVNGEALL